MTSLEDKASGGPEDVVLARELPGVYVLGSLELENADGIGTDDFPQYGDFLECQYATGDMEPVWVECPQDLAGKLVEQDAEPGDVLGITSSRKGPGGRWVVAVEVHDSVEDVHQ